MTFGAIPNIGGEYNVSIILEVARHTVGVKVELEALAHVNAVNSLHDVIRHFAAGNGSVVVSRISIIVVTILA
jgi:hypothetical protein